MGLSCAHLFSIIEPILYLISLLYVYLILIPNIGFNVKRKCIENRHCSKYFQQTRLGYLSDNADNQYRDFKNSISLVLIAMFASYVLQYFLRSVLKKWVASTNYKKLIMALFHSLFGAIVIWVQHKWHSVVVYLLIILSYFVTKFIAPLTKYPSSCIWIFGISVMLFKECYRYHWLQKYYLLDVIFDTRSYGGIYAWHVPANFLVLRIISFGIDYQSKRKEDELKGLLVGSQYDFAYMFAYCTYAPLYIAGPIIQYRDFLHHLESPYREESLFKYTVRLLFAVSLMEFMSHMFPFFAVLKTGLFNMLSPSEIVVVSYMTLKMMWLKFLIIWRFFRLWALIDGMNPPENMIKCMSNNHSLEGFWRGWHASFNKWILKYMYIPLGGTQSKIWSVWLIFLFVAIWHDLEVKLISWGALNSLFLVVEAIGRRISKASAYCSLPHFARYALEVTSGAAYIFVLVGVNMIGYSVGIGGLTSILTKLNSKEGCLVLSYSYGILLIGVCIMQYYDRLLVRFSNNLSMTTNRKDD